MLTIRAEVKRQEQKVDGTFNVKLRFTLNRQVKRISTSLFVSPSDLTKTGTFKKQSPVTLEINELVQAYQRKCNSFKIDLHNYTLDDVFTLLRFEEMKSQKIDFIQFSKDWIANATIKGASNYSTALNSFVRFIGKSQIEAREITSSMIKDYKSFLEKEHQARIKKLIKKGQRGLSNRAVSLYLISIKKLFKELKKAYNNQDMNLILVPNDPFAYIEIPKQEATRKRAIDSKLIKTISQLKDKQTFKGVHHTNRYNLAKDCFILSFCLIGMNSADLYSATEFDGKKITYYRKKTTDRRLDNAKMEVIVPKLCMPIFNRYRDTTGKRLFNFYQNYSDEKVFNKALNKGLKQIGEELKIEDLEFYAARHSWATIAVNKVKIDKYTVHAALNHIDDSMKVTDIYIERDFVLENEANAKVLRYVFGTK